MKSALRRISESLIDLRSLAMCIALLIGGELLADTLTTTEASQESASNMLTELGDIETQAIAIARNQFEFDLGTRNLLETYDQAQGDEKRVAFMALAIYAEMTLSQKLDITKKDLINAFDRFLSLADKHAKLQGKINSQSEAITHGATLGY